MDQRGRMYRSVIPDGAPDSEAPLGMILGPPDVADYVGLPEPIATRLHNILHKKGLFSMKEVKRDSNALFSALQLALRVDVHMLMDAYVKAGIETYQEEKLGG
jgi:hypothetical protein